MGYLEDMAKAKGWSLGELARRAVKRSDWPKGEPMNHRSIENMLRFVDQRTKKGQVWLDKRPDVRQILAGILGIEPEELDPGVQEPDAPADPRVRLTELVKARPIDLRREPLCPGIPREVLEPAGWQRCWWEAGAGSGKTLVGRWLEARGLATYLRVQDLSEAISRMPETGPVYIELTEEEGASGVEWAKLEGRCVCVAASWVHPHVVSQQIKTASTQDGKKMRTRRRMGGEMSILPSSGPADQLLPEGEGTPLENTEIQNKEWSRITAPKQGEWLEQLIRWVGERMEEGGGFEVEAMLDIAKQWSDFLKTPGDCIGLCGVLEEVGVEGFGKDKHDKIAERFLDMRAERPDLGGKTRWKGKALWQLMVGCVEGIWVHTGRPDASPLVRELREWLPTDALPPGDNTMLLALADDPASGPEQFEQAKRLARPTVNGAIDELIRLKLIETERGRATLRPTWLVQVAEQAVRERLLAEPQRGLGRVLLSPEGAVWWLGVLRDRFLSGGDGAGWSLVRYALDSLDAEDAASVVLLEAVFRAVGIALLRREVKERLEKEFRYQDLLHRLWQAQMRVVVDFGEVHSNGSKPWLLPRCFYIEKYNGEGMDNTWMLSALSISESLWDMGRIVTGLFVPWARSEPTSVDSFFLLNIGNICLWRRQNPEPPDYGLDAWRLIGRLYRHFGGKLRTKTDESSQIEAPFVLFDAMRLDGKLEWQVSFLSAEPEHLWEYFFMLGEDDGFSREAIMVALWRASGQSEMYDIPYIFRKKMMKLLPIDVIREFYSKCIGRGNDKYDNDGPIYYRYLSEEQWSVILDLFRETKRIHHLRFLPKTLVRRVLREQDHYHTSLPEDFWDRYPGTCTEEAAANLLCPPSIIGHAAMFFAMAPDRYVADIIRHLRSRMQQADLSPEVRSNLIWWARARALRRGPGWQEAWKLLQELSPVPGARPPDPQ